MAGALGACALLGVGAAVAASGHGATGSQVETLDALRAVASLDVSTFGGADAATAIKDVASRAVEGSPSPYAIADASFEVAFVDDLPNGARSVEASARDRAYLMGQALLDVQRQAGPHDGGADGARRVRDRLVGVVGAALSGALGDRLRGVTVPGGPSHAGTDAMETLVDLARVEVSGAALRDVLDVLLQDVDGRRLSAVSAMAQAGLARSDSLGRAVSVETTGALRR